MLSPPRTSATDRECRWLLVEEETQWMESTNAKTSANAQVVKLLLTPDEAAGALGIKRSLFTACRLAEAALARGRKVDVRIRGRKGELAWLQ